MKQYSQIHANNKQYIQKQQLIEIQKKQVPIKFKKNQVKYQQQTANQNLIQQNVYQHDDRTLFDVENSSKQLIFNEGFDGQKGHEGPERLEIVDMNTNDATPNALQDLFNKERVDQISTPTIKLNGVRIFSPLSLQVFGQPSEDIGYTNKLPFDQNSKFGESFASNQLQIKVDANSTDGPHYVRQFLKWQASSELTQSSTPNENKPRKYSGFQSSEQAMHQIQQEIYRTSSSQQFQNIQAAVQSNKNMDSQLNQNIFNTTAAKASDPLGRPPLNKRILDKIIFQEAPKLKFDEYTELESVELGRNNKNYINQRYSTSFETKSFQISSNQLNQLPFSNHGSRVSPLSISQSVQQFKNDVTQSTPKAPAISFPGLFPENQSHNSEKVKRALPKINAKKLPRQFFINDNQSQPLSTKQQHKLMKVQKQTMSTAAMQSVVSRREELHKYNINNDSIEYKNQADQTTSNLMMHKINQHNFIQDNDGDFSYYASQQKKYDELSKIVVQPQQQNNSYFSAFIDQNGGSYSKLSQPATSNQASGMLPSIKAKVQAIIQGKH